MILKHLRLRNFRRYAELFLEFPENVIGVIGRNGAGKSTLLEAIAWALYGSRAVRTDKLLMRRQQAPLSEPCEVELAFTLAGDDYVVQRALRGANAAVEAALYRAGDSDKLAVRESGVNEAIAHLLGLDHKSFEVSIFARQKELAALSTLTDEPRRKLVSRLIDLEAIDLARQNALNDANQKRKFLEGARAHQVNIEELQQQLSGLRAERLAAAETLQSRQQEEQHWARQAEKERVLWEEESRRRDHFQKLQGQLQKVQGQAQEVHLQLQHADKEKQELSAHQMTITALLPARPEVEKLRHEKESLEKQRRALIEREGKQGLANNLSEQVSALQSEAEPLHKSLAGLPALMDQEQAWETRWQEAQLHLQNLRENEKALSNQQSAVEARGRELKEKLQRVQTLGQDSPCPVCTRPLREHYLPVVAEFDKNLLALRQEYSALAEQRKTAARHLHEAEEAGKALLQEKQRLSAEREKLRQHQNQLAALQNRLTTLQQQLALVQNEIQHNGAVAFDAIWFEQVNKQLAAQEDKVRELIHLEGLAANLPALEARRAQLQDKVLDLNAQETNLQQQMASLQFLEETFLASQRAYHEAASEHLRHHKSASEAQAAVASLAALIGQLEPRIAQAQEHAAAIARTEREVVLLEALQEHFKNFRAEMAGRLRPLIAARASEILRLATNGRYTLLELDESYNLFLFDQNQKFELARFSGGEQDLLNLCLRVAISQVIAQRSGRPPLQFIVLDEIFGSQDEERKFLLLSTLQHLSSYFRQVFLVTHEQSVKDNLPVVFEVQMNGDTSEIKAS